MPADSCPNCGGALESTYAEKYCSLPCFHEHRSFAGEDNPNYQGAKETTSCKICGVEFEFYPSEKPGTFCPECVEHETWQTTPHVSGPDHPRWTGGPTERECTVCGSRVARYPSEFASRIVLCGESCKRQWLSESFTGEGRPNWKGGGNEAYGRGWTEARRKALERDEFACQRCARGEDELGRNPDVHHIVTVRQFVEAAGADKTDAHVLRNLVTLCVACHRRADFGRPSKLELKQLIGAV